jgi:glycosyltransferase involved in cell wall biosynthesis
MHKTKLSIITINYNNLGGLKKTVESVVNQTWQEFEYVVIDGGSTDGSKAFIESQSDKIDYWISKPDKGIYNAMNKGILEASGEYLLFLNSGDHFFNNEVLENCIQKINSFDLIFSDLQMINTTGTKIALYRENLRFSDLYFGSLPHPATFIKKTLFEVVGLFDENLKIVSDWKFFILALFKYHCTYAKIDTIVATFYSDGISSTNDYSLERSKVLNDCFKEYVLDYEIFSAAEKHQKLLEMNRFKMLAEMEKSPVGKKISSVFFRTYLFLFSKKKLKDILS